MAGRERLYSRFFHGSTPSRGSANDGPGMVDRDRDNEGAKGGAFLKAFDCFRECEKRFMNEIFGAIFITQESTSESAHVFVVKIIGFANSGQFTLP